MEFRMPIASALRTLSPPVVAATSIDPIALPKDEIAARSKSLSPDKFLKRASSRQINLGTPSSSTKE
jgi:hypothetical protein